MARWTFAAPRGMLTDGDKPLSGCYYNVSVSQRPIIAEAYTARDAEELRVKYRARYKDSLEVKIDGEVHPSEMPLL